MCKTKEEYTMIRSGSIIVESDNDLEIVGTIVSGFDYLNNLIVEYRFEDYRSCGKDYSYSAIIDEDDAKVMARYLNVPLSSLPKVLYDKFGCPFSDILVPSEVEGIFGDILNFVLDCGARYKLKR